MLPLTSVRPGRSSWRSASNFTTPLLLPAPVPCDARPADDGVADRVGDQDLVGDRAAADVDRIEVMLEVRPVAGHFLRLVLDEDRVGGRVDDRRGRDADLRRDVAAADGAVGDRRDGAAVLGRQQGVLPENGAGVGVDGVEAVVLGRDKNDVVRRPDWRPS